MNFGAFVDLGGVDGLVHVSELSWKHVDHPGEVVTVGQEVEVEVLDVDLERERVSLSLKATQEDPWKEFERRYQAGEIIEGQVTKLVPFGAFVRVAPGIEGLVHISELSHEHVDTPESVLSVGDEVRAKVIDVDVPRRRVSLSMRQVTDKPRATEIEVEVEKAPAAEAAEPEMAPAMLEVPQAILDAVAEAEATAEETPDAEPAVSDTEAAMDALAEVSASADTAPAEVPAVDEVEAPAEEAPAAAEPETPEVAERGAVAEPEAPRRARDGRRARGGDAVGRGLARGHPRGPEAPRGPSRVRGAGPAAARRDMLLVGLTGGIGSGKSTVAELLAGRGAAVIDADDLARRAVAPGTDGFDRVVETFGREILGPGRRHRSIPAGRDRCSPIPIGCGSSRRSCIRRSPGSTRRRSSRTGRPTGSSCTPCRCSPSAAWRTASTWSWWSWPTSTDASSA